MSQESDFVVDERIGVRFGSTQLALRAWVRAARRRDPRSAADMDDGSYVFAQPRWIGGSRRIVVTIRVVPDEDVTAVRVEVFGPVGSRWLQRRRCRSMVRRLLARAEHTNHNRPSNGPRGGLRMFPDVLRRQPVPIPARRDDGRYRPR